MSMSRLVVAFGGEMVREWDVTGDALSIRGQYIKLRDILRNPAPLYTSFFELEGYWGPHDGKAHHLLVRIADIKGLDLQEGVDVEASR